MVRLGPRPLSFCIGVPLSLHVDSLSCVTSSSHVASLSHVALRAIVIRRCQWVMVLGVWGFSWCRAPMAIRGWWCGDIVVSWSGGEVSSSLSMGWPLTIPQCPCQLWACLLSDRRPGAANEVSEVGGNDNGVATHLPQRPRHIHGMGAPLVCYRACTVVLGLQTRLVRWGAMTTGGWQHM